MFERKIRDMYKNRGWNERVTNIIIEFVTNIQKVYGDKYINRILDRLSELEEIKEYYDDSKYLASSKKNYIVFFKDIKDENNFKYVLEHELFHFIQKEGSAFEKIPKKYENILEINKKIFLLEEAFVQYFTAKINNKMPEYITKDENGDKKKYWLNECYSDIVGVVEELEAKIGKVNLLDIYMDDERYEDEIEKFDKRYGENAFGKYIEKICK